MFDFLLRAYKLNFGRDKAYYKIIDALFGFVPNNIELYKLALIHKSASLVLEDGQAINNERLEFLGDAVIEAVTSDYLFIEYPDRDEGFLTQLRSKIVSRQSLNVLAVKIGLDAHVISNGNGNAGVIQKHIFGDAFEAVMGAIYLDKGYEFVNRLLINDIYLSYLNLEELTESESDFKSRLIEWCQKNRHKILFRTGYDRESSQNHPVFYATVLIDGMEVGHGSGDSKKEAEQRAAFSVAEYMSDEQCALVLDKLDKLDCRPEVAARKTSQEAPTSDISQGDNPQKDISRDASSDVPEQPSGQMPVQRASQSNHGPSAKAPEQAASKKPRPEPALKTSVQSAGKQDSVASPKSPGVVAQPEPAIASPENSELSLSPEQPVAPEQSKRSAPRRSSQRAALPEPAARKRAAEKAAHDGVVAQSSTDGATQPQAPTADAVVESSMEQPDEVSATLRDTAAN